ncbi:MAG: hypothetical protein UY63_C0004G0038 [Parcubacteria group bacterium GW2011_GWA2_51_10]|nr:MAG: hypothetical protein UY63_C0004G0038 [Parcubacteria group bacterium GW2011_GWA2_51_10]
MLDGTSVKVGEILFAVRSDNTEPSPESNRRKGVETRRQIPERKVEGKGIVQTTNLIHWDESDENRRWNA